jgi:hypothetical protein
MTHFRTSTLGEYVDTMQEVLLTNPCPGHVQPSCSPLFFAFSLGPRIRTLRSTPLLQFVKRIDLNCLPNGDHP